MARDLSVPAGPMRVAVLAGGTSAERPISLESGAAVADALRQGGHTATLVDPADAPLQEIDWNRFDVAFLALHGTFGEDGGVQQILEDAGVPYTGSDVLASRTAFSKTAAKERFGHCGVPTPVYVIIHEADDASQIYRAARRLGYPLVVKPDAQGSSLGVSICQSPDDLPEALSRCFHFGPYGLIETMIVGTEWTVGLLDDLVLPVIQIETPRGFFDYQAKYHDDDTRYLFDFKAGPAVARDVQNAALRAARAVGASGLARVDLRVDGWGQPWVLEVNTIPGFTSHSLVPKAAARAGISFTALCERAIQSAFRRLPSAAPNATGAQFRSEAARLRRVG